MRKHSKIQQGFTLIELLVAMSFFAIAMAGIQTTVNNTTANAGYLRTKTSAHWVAMNKLTEMRITSELKKKWPSIGRNEGQVEMAGRKWYWKTEVEKTPGGFAFRRIVVDVFDTEDDESALTSVIGYVSKPPPATTP